MAEFDTRTWMQWYYQHPMPEHAMRAFTELTSEPEFVGLPELQGLTLSLDPWSRGPWPLIVFYAELMRAHPERTEAWAQQVRGHEHERVFLLAIWMSDTPEGRASLAGHGGDSESVDMAQSLAQSPPPQLGALEVSGPIILDMMWSAFFASGDVTWVERIMTAFSMLGAPEGSPTYAVGSSALWSITANAREHPRIRELCTELRAEQEDGSGFAYLLDSILDPAQ